MIDTVKIEVVRLFRINNEKDPLKAFADILIPDFLVIKGFRIIEGKNGLFVGFPKCSSLNGKWYENIIPLSKEAKEAITTIILDAYNSE